MSWKQAWGTGVAALLVATTLSCERDFGLGIDSVEYPTIETIVYSRHVQPLLSQKCATAGCHNATTAAEGLSLNSWESLMRGSVNGAMVIPFRPEKSHLIFHLNTDSTIAPVALPTMPPAQPFTRNELDFLMRWIREGAKNDLDQVPFSDTPSGRVFVTNQAEDEVAVIDVESNLLVRMVSVGSLDNRVTPPESPHNIVIDRQLQYFYVNLIVANEVWKYRVRDNAFVAKLNLGEKTSPAQIALTPDGSAGFVSNFDPTGTNRSIQVFNTQTMQITNRIANDRIWAPHGVTMMHNGTTLWTANQQSDNLCIVDTRAIDEQAIVKVDPTVPDVPLGSPRFGPYQLVFTPDDRIAYVTCRFSNEVRVFDTQTRSLVAVIPVGVNPLILDISPDGRRVYVANRGGGTSPSKSVSVINTSLNREIQKIDDVGVDPHGIAVTSDGLYVYVSCENLGTPDAPHHPVSGLKTPGFVAVINAATNQVIARIEVGAFAAGIAFVPSP